MKKTRQVILKQFLAENRILPGKGKAGNAEQRLYIAEIIAGSDEAAGTPMSYGYYVEQLGGPPL